MEKGKKVVNKVLHFLGFERENEREREEIDWQQDDFIEEKNIETIKKAPIVGLPTAKQNKIVVLSPISYEEAKGMSDHLKGKKQIIVNFEKTDQEDAQRIVDFLSGVTYAMNGGMQKVGQNIFLFTPSNTVISSDNKKEVSKLINMTWTKGD
ncbi:cell division inhibitor SepF [Desulfitispora alkaliphila]|uniref:cell division protein SepF n=1 Tax=Desulfitispora alkaliphila TaxID=622674 RepID=UPI003D23018E